MERRERAAWLKRGQTVPDWIFSSVTGTPLDESNVRKALNRVLDAAGLHRCGPHQLRHTFASLMLEGGAPITYVSQQLGHRDSAITLRVYAHWLPESQGFKGVNLLDDAARDATQTPPATDEHEWGSALSAYGRMVSQEGIEPSTRRLRVCCSAN